MARCGAAFMNKLRWLVCIHQRRVIFGVLTPACHVPCRWDAVVRCLDAWVSRCPRYGGADLNVAARGRTLGGQTATSFAMSDAAARGVAVLVGEVSVACTRLQSQAFGVW